MTDETLVSKIHEDPNRPGRFCWDDSANEGGWSGYRYQSREAALRGLERHYEAARP